MKKSLRVLCLILAVLMFAACAVGSGSKSSGGGSGSVATTKSSKDAKDEEGDGFDDVDAIDTSEFYQGYKFYYGSYPQLKVYDVTTIAYLDDQEVTLDHTIDDPMIDFYHEYDATYENVAFTISYGDFVYNGMQYRKVVVTGEYSDSNKNGDLDYYHTRIEQDYYLNKAYYYEWQPVEWTVCGIRNNEYIACTTDILDYYPYYESDTDWEHSARHSFVTDEMQNMLFTEQMQKPLLPFEDGSKLSLFSLEEITDGHLGFSDADTYDSVRVSHKSDYADLVCGHSIHDDYVLRTIPDAENGDVYLVEDDGLILESFIHGTDDNGQITWKSDEKAGIRPIIKFPAN